jgi:hypothetical protein
MNMEDKIIAKIDSLSKELQSLVEERQLMQKRDQEIEIRWHQLVGSIYELQQLIVDQPLIETTDLKE